MCNIPKVFGRGVFELTGNTKERTLSFMKQKVQSKQNEQSILEQKQLLFTIT